MKASSTTINKSLLRIRRDLFGNGFPKMYAGGDPPLRSELLSADQMEDHGKNLAASHSLETGFTFDQYLLNRLAENESTLIDVRNLIINAVKEKRQLTPAGEWILDNFYLIEEHIQIGKRHLPKGYSRELPRLRNGPSKGLPRVYDIALESISHGDGRVDPERLSRFIRAYQKITVLKLGELWAIPIMLRLALIENLRRVAALVAESRIDRNLADTWADKLMEVAQKDPKNLILVIADMARSKPSLSASFVSEFVRRMHGQSPILALPLTWVDQQLSESGFSIDRLVQLGNQQQAANQISISNSIDSLRYLGSTDWKEFVETMSVVEQTLRYDPGGSYGRMDFQTRDIYRHIIEKIAKNSIFSEGEIAHQAIHLAQQSSHLNGDNDRSSHVGYYLIDNGLPQLEKIAKVRFSLRRTFLKLSRQFNFVLYTGSILLLTFLISSGLFVKLLNGPAEGWLNLFMAVIIFLSTFHLSTAIINWLATLLVSPKTMPRMNFSDGIPPESRTLVVIPTMLINRHNINELAEALEVRFLANRDENLHFGLLTDFRDAPREHMEGDDILLDHVKQKIEGLNLKYRESENDIFYLFHRPRKWNPGEGVWMGHERKRGKLSELNELLRGNKKDNFSLIIGNIEILSNVRFVITLDSDTQLPRDSARHFVGAMAHPLNRANYDEKRQRVCDGYGIMQPRVGISLPGSSLSRYSKLFGSDPGIDPYTRAVSDVYQDLFREGSFIGKGIYDVDTFQRVFHNKLPDNQILSHDLLEGCYARSGLISDVQLYEEYPSSYEDDVKRRHRWIRGDWQITKWILPYVTGVDGRLKRNPLSALSRFKIFDNLRRSLTPLSMMLLLIYGWTISTDPFFWTMVVLGLMTGSAIIISILDLLNKKDDVLLKHHLNGTLQSAKKHLAQSGFLIASLPYEAYYSTDAIIRTLWRVLVSRRKMLEWNPSGLIEANINDLKKTYKNFWFSLVFSIITLTGLAVWWPLTLGIALPLLIAWLTFPITVWWISLVPERHIVPLTRNQILYLREISRRTWAFFESFVGQEDNWLPPDNFQEYPVPVIAHRTSPTNIGFSLLANLSAYDFGYINIKEVTDRTLNTFRTLEIMERYKGHFYNWYDTRTLEPLMPRYISSVDSGNLVGYVMILRSGLLALPEHKVIRHQQFEAISDTLRILMGIMKGNISPLLNQFKNDLELVIGINAPSLPEAHMNLEKLAIIAAELEEDYTGSANDSSWWAQTLAHQCQSILYDLEFLFPWLKLPEHADFSILEKIPSLNELSKIDTMVLPALEHWLSVDPTPEKIEYAKNLRSSIIESVLRANDRLATIESLIHQSQSFIDIEYDFLYDKGRHLLSIGFNVEERHRDSSFYDLLASEARFSTFIGIAQGLIPQESWFALGRLLTAVDGDPVLLSWSGSMFEYLMPLLVMPNYNDTLLDQTYNSVVSRQVDYGKERGVPWGFSESGYNLVDVHLNYQYKAFGVPGTGLKRGLVDDLVVAPYATMMALMIQPKEAYINLERLAAENMVGKYGYYEAMDYTKSRLNRGQTGSLVQSYMAHHQGMSLLAMAYLLLDRPMQKRFESDPLFQSALLLLQERIPKTTAYYSDITGSPETSIVPETHEMPVRTIKTPFTPIPEVHLLSNGRYHVMVTNSGGGYSIWNNISVTRWREDTTCDNWGMFCYIRDIDTGEFWSTSYQPTLYKPKKYEAIFSKGRAEFRRSDNELDTHTEIVVSPEDDIELRRVRITNSSRTKKRIDVTSYAEVVLASAVSDALHPAFSNLFVQTEIIDQRQTILCSRRPRSVDEKVPWMFHLMTMHGAEFKEVSYETDRSKFIGRGNSIINPSAMTNPGPLSGSQGSVLDPVVSIRYMVILDPEESVKIDIVSGITETREAALNLVEKYQDRRLTNRVFELAWTYSHIILRQINATEADAQLYGRLASSIIFANSSLRAEQNLLVKNRRGQSGLWGYSISGDLPIVLLQIEDPANIRLVRQLIQAHSYWRLKGLAVDLVIWNEDHAGYRQVLQEQILGLVTAGLEANLIDRPGGIFVRASDQIANEDRILFQTVARVIITDRGGSMAQQINRRSLTEASLKRFVPSRNYRPDNKPEQALPRHDLLYYNGIGGFTQDGREYVITTTKSQITPAPWVNVIANPEFGTVISENGNAYTWRENAHEIRLTPWNNDPVTDSGGEAIFIRDEESGHFWSPTPIQIDRNNPYVSRHGFGYSVFEHTEDGIQSELCVYVAIDAPIKFSVLKLKNNSGRPRKISVTGYVEWVLGDLRPKSVMHVSTRIDPGSGALFAKNPYSTEFGERVAFFQTDDAYRNLTCDRTEFIGRNGTLRDPAAMYQSRLSGRVGAGFDPCSAFQVSFDLIEGQERETIFRLGAGRNADDAARLVLRFWGYTAARNALEAVWKFWKNTLGSIQVESSDPSINVLVNGWLMYQTLACRIWARSGYYQSGGAFGFRDQLQDSMALLHIAPYMVRSHLILCASRQFKEGDVQHWWHPPSGRGVRTHCSDDYLWLPLVTCRYVIYTGDTGILDEPIHFLEGQLVNPTEDSYYDLPGRSDEVASLYQHCVRAIHRGLRFGIHGLPLIGTGDWNDGMNLVGNEGKGESVWLGFFLYEVLMQFSKIAKLNNDQQFTDRCLKEADNLKGNIEKNCWDGEWYLRAWFDDGTPLGSESNSECRIDSISQSWSVLSGAGDNLRSRIAMESVYKHLVRKDQSLVRLLDPPFDKSELNPGYIKGYVPGVRENGGQYTHAAIWAAMAFAKSGDIRRAWELLGIINPVNHSKSAEDLEIYKAEPYVVAADVYGVSPHTGRAGWTWYTGSAGWMYRLIIESLLGLRIEVDKLYIEPVTDAGWKNYKIHYRFRGSVYHISILLTEGPAGLTRSIVDGVPSEEKGITLLDDGNEHFAEINIVRNDGRI